MDGVKGDGTVVGEECHIVAQRDKAPAVRRPSQLSKSETEQFATLIEQRHSSDNLVVLCPTHHKIVDDPSQAYSVARLVKIKAAHEREVEEALQAKWEAGTASETTVPSMFVEDAGRWERKAMAALAREDPEGLKWLHDNVGLPVDDSALRRLADDWLDLLAEGREYVVQALARLLEARGDFARAAKVWERYAYQTGNTKFRADRLVRASIDADAAQDVTSAARLADEAEALDPQCPRLVLHRVVDDASPEETLQVLSGLQVLDDDPLMALIESQRAVSWMLLEKVHEAEVCVAEAERLAPDDWNTRSTRANLEIQRGRIATRDGAPLALDDLKRAKATVLEIRDELLQMRRWAESARLLMLAADVEAMLANSSAAAELLRRATAEEVEVGDNNIVLGDAALRTGDAQLAREFILVKPTTVDAERRVLAAAEIELPNHPSAPALQTLREIALSESPERVNAALARLIACLYPTKAAWDDEVAASLDGTHHEPAVDQLRVLYLAMQGDWAGVAAAEAQLPNTPSAAKARLNAAQGRGDREGIINAAKEVLIADTGASGRLSAGQSFAFVGHEDADQILLGVARDRNAPAAIRDEAYHAAFKLFRATGQMHRAQADWTTWQTLVDQEPEVSRNHVSQWWVQMARL